MFFVSSTDDQHRTVRFATHLFVTSCHRVTLCHPTHLKSKSQRAVTRRWRLRAIAITRGDLRRMFFFRFEAGRDKCVYGVGDGDVQFGAVRFMTYNVHRHGGEVSRALQSSWGARRGTSSSGNHHRRSTRRALNPRLALRHPQHMTTLGAPRVRALSYLQLGEEVQLRRRIRRHHRCTQHMR